jgi:general secretion pathway protein D
VIARSVRLFLTALLFFSFSTVCLGAKLSEKALEEEGRLVTMDFRGVEIDTLVKFIGELTGKNFVVDERVRGKVTAISPTKITVDEAYKVFESILEVHGFTTVPAGKVIKVVPATEARGKSLTTTVGREALPDADTMITQVVPIRHATVNDVKALFTPLVSKNSLLVAYQPTNTLIVTDVLSNINRLLKILNEVDIPGYALQLAVIPLHYASAEVVSQELKTLFEAGRTPSRAPTPRPKVEAVEISAPEELKLIPDERTNSLIVLATAQTIEMIKGIVVKLDQEVPRGKGNIHVYYLEHAVAEDLATILTGVAQEAKEGAKPGTGATGKLTILGEKISITADKTTNSLIIIASPQDYSVIEEVIKKLDIVRAQVYVEALIAEVTLDKVKDLGVEWNATEDVKGEVDPLGGTDFGLMDAVQGAGETALSGLIMGVTKGFVTVDGTDIPDLKALLHFYSGDSDVNVLSTPRLLTTDNEEAEILVGEERPFLKSSQLTTEGSTVRTWEYKDVGITLKITPHISKGKLLRLEIFTEIKSFVEELAGEVGAVVTTKRQATTSVIVEDASTVVIAGLIRDDKTGSIAKVPILGDIPLLGWLFKSRRQAKIKTNLLIFITPRIVNTAEDLLKITEEEKAQREKHIEEHQREKKKVFPLFEGGD